MNDSSAVVKCEASKSFDFLNNKLSGKSVTIVSDPTQNDRDAYDRLLRYVLLDGVDVGKTLIENGYGKEYTYQVAYQKQAEYRLAQKDAETHKRGLWANGVCAGSETVDTTNTVDAAPSSTQATCSIKGNISSSGEKIYHLPGQEYYDSIIIEADKGESIFCSEAEAISAGFRKSKI